MARISSIRCGRRSGLLGLATRFFLIVVLLSGLDVVHDGRLGWPASTATRFEAWLDEADPVTDRPLRSAQSDLQGSAAGPTATVIQRGSSSGRAPAQPSRDPAVEIDLEGRVAKVIDGDSLEVQISGVGPVEVRLHGIDAPEWDQPYGRAAKRQLSRLIRGLRIGLDSRNRDSYGRLLATVFHDGRNINLEMVRRGYAWWYRRYATFDGELRRAEEEARSQKIGLWNDADPVPPWVWRRG